MIRMKKPSSPTIALLMLVIINFQAISTDLQGGEKGWKAGVAKVNITPKVSMWMAGYAARNHPSEGVLNDLWTKALAIEDSKGKKAILITNDLVQVPKPVSDRIRDRIGAKYGLTRSQIILNSSHTHSGPVLYNTLGNIYPLDDEQLARVKAYKAVYEQQVIDLAGQAISAMKPAKIYSANGVTRFAVNRRNNPEASANAINEMNGPSDYAVPVLKVADESGKIMAVAFGYSCHATVLSGYQFSGDYPGFAQTELEKAYPEATALFFQCAGADQNPLPRRTIPLAVQYGKSLAAAVERVLDEPMRELAPVLTTVYSEINLQFANPVPTKEELIKLMAPDSKTPDYLKRNAQTLINRLDRGEVLKDYYPYPCQVWKLGDQAVMALGGELLVDYALELKKKFGNDIFVLGYSNDVMAYIPPQRVLKEEGYEGTRSAIFTTPWNMNIEPAILGEMDRLAKMAGVEVK
jgi:hypothetical protein